MKKLANKYHFKIHIACFDSLVLCLKKNKIKKIAKSTKKLLKFNLNIYNSKEKLLQLLRRLRLFNGKLETKILYTKSEHVFMSCAAF